MANDFQLLNEAYITEVADAFHNVLNLGDEVTVLTTPQWHGKINRILRHSLVEVKAGDRVEIVHAGKVFADEPEVPFIKRSVKRSKRAYIAFVFDVGDQVSPDQEETEVAAAAHDMVQDIEEVIKSATNGRITGIEKMEWVEGWSSEFWVKVAGRYEDLFRVWRALLRNKGINMVLPTTIQDFEEDITIEDFE